MTIDPALFNILQCPSCRGQVRDDHEFLTCTSCARTYTVSAGIPDMTCFGPETATGDSHRMQAAHEAEVHDRMAESGYEKQIIRIYGTKTRLLAHTWLEIIARLPQPLRVLDYGCGTGQLSCVLGKRFRPLFAVDVSAESVRKNVAENGVLGCVANGLFLPFKDGAFDIVCLSGVLHHILDLPRATKELARISTRYVFISDIQPHSGPALRRLAGYPHMPQKLLYGLWTFAWLVYSILLRAAGRALDMLGISRSPKIAIPSKYERPISAVTVEKLFQEAGLITERLQYWTNLSVPGDYALKRWATRALVNNEIGSHFDMMLRHR